MSVILHIKKNAIHLYNDSSFPDFTSQFRIPNNDAVKTNIIFPFGRISHSRALKIYPLYQVTSVASNIQITSTVYCSCSHFPIMRIILVEFEITKCPVA